jgi:ubiquinone/menaquinone biosynthesis C-methylase UbiE
MSYIKNTRGVIEHTRHYVSGYTLDFGAGTAKYQHLIKEKASKYITFDMVPGKNIDVVGDALNPPFADGTFDTVVSTQVLEHVRKPWVMVREMGRIIKSGGICITTAPFIVPFHADPDDYFRYTRQGLESLFTDSGFTIVESGSYGRMFSVFSEMIHFSLFNPYKKDGVGKWGMRAMRYLERLASSLDRHMKNKIIYANVYVIAKKI